MNIGLLTRHEISFKKPLETAFWENMAKAIEKLRHCWLLNEYSFPCVQKVLEIKNCTKFTKGW